MNTIFIGIAGGTGSGKTTLTEHLVSRFGDDIAVVHHDNYYKRQDCSFEERCKQNYDHPDAFDTDLMIRDLKKLKAGETIYCPVYDYAIHNRIDAAYDYLSAHPESRCVASGGQNNNEPISEAACIRNTLAARGIDPDRILLEDRSRSTEENLRFTAEIIRQQGLNPRVAIASDNFHQLRASVWAGRCGLEAESLGCASWWPLGPGYWAREAVAVVVLGIRTAVG